MKKQIVSFLMTILHIFFLSTIAESVVYVDINSLPVPGDGDSWSTAYHTIQQGLDDADVLDEEVWVADGIYYEQITLREGVEIYGGFSGHNELEETERNQRDWENNPTIMDGSQLNPGGCYE